jgi:hypothetical protein
VREKIAVCAFIILILGACEDNRASQMPNAVHQAEELVQDLADGKCAAVRDRFDAAMSQALSDEQLRDAWTSVVAVVGPFREIVGTRETTEGRYRPVFVTGRFDGGYVDIKVVYGLEGKVSGLFFVPSGQWDAPEYASAAGIDEIAVTVTTGKYSLPGTLTLPRDRRNCPAVVLVHGTGAHDQDETIGPNRPFKDIAWGLASRGVAVLRYEKRTRKYGQDAAPNPAEFTTRQETVDDAVSALELLARTAEVDRDRLFVLGHSLGGMLCPRIAAAAATKPAGLVILAGNARPLETLLLEQVVYLASRDGNVDEKERKLIDAVRSVEAQLNSPGFQASEMVDLLGMKVPGGYLLDLHEYDPVAAARDAGLPMLVLRGSRDYQVTEEDMRIWQEGLDDLSDIEFKTYDGVNHLFMKGGEGPAGPEEYLVAGHVAPEVISDVAAWISGTRGISRETGP